MSNTRRHQAGTMVAGQKTGGQFRAHERAAAVAPPQAETPRTVSVTAPARILKLERPAAPIEWPADFTNPQVDFGEDDNGRFFSTYTFEHAENGEVTFIYTDFEDGPDFGDSADHSILDEVSETIGEAHHVLRRNHYLAGAAALNEEPNHELYRRVKAVSLGEPEPADLAKRFEGKPDQAAMHRAKQLFAAYGSGSPDEPEEHEVQDMISDLAWVAKQRGFDFDELVARAQRIQEDEEQNPDF